MNMRTAKRNAFIFNNNTDRLVSRFNGIAEETEERLRNNPFSETWEKPKFDPRAEDYARPPKGSLTEFRAKKGGNYMLGQIIHLCELINKYGEGPPERKTITYGYLFKIYEFYSDMVVGLLIRARKYGMVDFQGEMLYQRQDDHKPITMLKSLPEIYEMATYSGDPVNVLPRASDNKRRDSVDSTNTLSPTESDESPQGELRTPSGRVKKLGALKPQDFCLSFTNILQPRKN